MMMDLMQDFQVLCVFLDVIATQNLDFIKLKSWVNVAYTRAEDVLVIVADVVGLTFHKKEREY